MIGGGEGYVHHCGDLDQARTRGHRSRPGRADPAPPRSRSPARSAVDTDAWQRRGHALTGWIGRQLARPRTRLAVIGVVLLVVAVLGITSSVWTLPLVIVGAAMVLIAWIGSRLEGRFAVEWGETGTQLEFRAQIKAPPAHAHAQLVAPASARHRPGRAGADADAD